MSIPAPAIPWAKLGRDKLTGAVIGWHTLVDHSADVAAVFERLLQVPLVASRLARLAAIDRLDEVWCQRLAALVGLHDFGKANRDFQARWDAQARIFAGHTREALIGLFVSPQRRLLKALLGLDAAEGWGAWPQSLLAVLAHHGRPLDASQSLFDDRQIWGRPGDDSVVRCLAPLGASLRLWFPGAFVAGGPPLPDRPAFWHAVAGLTMLADWLGSDTAFFPFAQGCCADGCRADGMAEARRRAAEAVRLVGFDPSPARLSMAGPQSFAAISPHPPRPLQTEAGAVAGHVVVLESETGSGKTEAALYRFARLFAAGEVDGLYFALPTRVAASSLYDRVREARDRLFPEPANRPGVLLAVPGYARFDGIEARPLPDFAVQWQDDPDDQGQAARWAALRPKRFLAGTIAVGTIDQALLGAIKVKHAHLRAVTLMRHLLVVDEVHASDRYMAHLLSWLLDLHRAAGGHALLLSATLGGEARARLLAGAPPPLAEAVAAPYPALSSNAEPKPVALPASGEARHVAVGLAAEMGDAAAIAARALQAAEAGAKVLVVRNTRRDAVATFEAMARLAPDHAALFRCAGVASLHHGRFALEDRVLLDAAVEAAIGRERPAGGLVLIGTQTLEQSLDIDADLLITDLCPADVLLQRLGRLHRHGWRRQRPPLHATPRAVILAPERMEPLLRGDSHGLGGKHGPYHDLVAVEATRRLILRHPVWSIPAMNRLLVEAATHSEAQEELIRELEVGEPAWRGAGIGNEGRIYAQLLQAAYARLRYDADWTSDAVVFPKGEMLSTRLGLRDLAVAFAGAGPLGPFGVQVKHLAIPDYWLRGGDGPSIDPAGDLTAHGIVEGAGGFTFLLQGLAFAYSAKGLFPKAAPAGKI